MPGVNRITFFISEIEKFSQCAGLTTGKPAAEELNKRIADFRRAAQNPNVDPRPFGKKLCTVLTGTD